MSNIIDFSKLKNGGNPGIPNGIASPKIPILGQKPEVEVYMVDDEKVQTLEDVKLILKLVTAKMVIPVPTNEIENFKEAPIYPFVKKIDLNEEQ